MSTVVKTYKKARHFQQDAPRMAARGYTVASTFQGSSRNRPLRNLGKMFVGGTRVWGASITGGKVVVTYQMASPGTMMSQGGFVAGQGARPSSPLRGYLFVTVAILTIAVVLVVALHPF